MTPAIKPGVPTVALIEGWSMHSACRRLDLNLNFGRVNEWLHDRADMLRAPAYFSTRWEADDRYSPVRPLIKWLRCNGYTATTKPIAEQDAPRGMSAVAVAMLEAVAAGARQIVLLGGDDDLVAAVESVQRRHNTRVVLVAHFPAGVAALRAQADAAIELAALRGAFERVPLAVCERTDKEAA